MAQSLAQKMDYLAQKHEKAAFILPNKHFPTFFLIRANWQRAFFFSSGKGILFILLSSFQASTDQAKLNRAADLFLSFPGCCTVIDPCKVIPFSIFLSVSLIYNNHTLIYKKNNFIITKYARARVSETRAKIPCFACRLI